VSVRITDETGLQARIDQAFRDAGVTAELVFGGVTEIRERRIGSLTYELGGSDTAADQAVAALRVSGITVDEEARA
jgi:D-methionine transport system ATP-binding protein